jgi:tight adherence protein C
MRLPTSSNDLVIAEAAQLYAVCSSAGVNHRESFLFVGRRLTKCDLPELKQSIEDVRGGASMETVLQDLSQRNSNTRLREFALAISLSSRLGTSSEQPLLQLANRIQESWLVDYRIAATSAETRMLLPQVAITLPLTILFALYPSLKLLSGWAL